MAYNYDLISAHDNLVVYEDKQTCPDRLVCLSYKKLLSLLISIFLGGGDGQFNFLSYTQIVISF